MTSSVRRASSSGTRTSATSRATPRSSPPSSAADRVPVSRAEVRRRAPGLVVVAAVLLALAACGGSQDNTRWLSYSQGREFQRAQALRREGRLDEARRLFANLRRLDPANVAAFREEIDLTREVSDLDSLRDELDTLLGAETEAEMRAAHLALRASLMADRAEKEAVLRRAIALDPECSVAHAELAICLEERREDEEAYRSWKRAATGRVPSPRVFRRLATLEEERHEDDEAIRLYENYLLLDPDDPWVLAKLGRLYLGRDAADRAESRLERAFELDSQDIDVIVNLAIAKVRNGRVESGLELMQRAERLDPRAPDIQENLGYIHAEKLKDYPKAIEHYRRYLELGGEDRLRVEGWIREMEGKLAR